MYDHAVKGVMELGIVYNYFILNNENTTKISLIKSQEKAIINYPLFQYVSIAFN
jgi:hypothetical protein